MHSSLVDRIYESSFVPEQWPGVLDELANIAGARSGTIYSALGDTYRAACSNPAALELLMPWIEKGGIEQTPRGQTASVVEWLPSCDTHFVREIDLPPAIEQQIRNDIFYREFLYKRGLGHAAGTWFFLPTGDCITFTLDRRLADGPVEDSAISRLDELRPHLGRAALTSARLQLERARTAAETLKALGLPALVIDEQSKVLAANDLFEGEMSCFVRFRAFDRFVFVDKAADQLFKEAMSVISITGSQAVRSFPVRNLDDKSPMIAHIVPVRLSARDIFVRCAAALIMTPISAPNAPPVELIQSLFDLTSSEARVARSLLSGKTVDEIASSRNVSTNTIRTQVRRVIEKTGCRRQSEVVALLAGVAPVSRV